VSAMPTMMPGAAMPRMMSGVDRATIARLVEHMLSAKGIARGSGHLERSGEGGPASTAKELPSPSVVASEIASRLFGAPAQVKSPGGGQDASPYSAAPQGGILEPNKSPSAAADGRHIASASKPEAPAKPAIPVSPFVSENDVRRAMTRSEKIFVGPKTILTPSARDLGLEHEVFVETEAGSIR
jgi:hypothetical protein